MPESLIARAAKPGIQSGDNESEPAEIPASSRPVTNFFLGTVNPVRVMDNL